MIKRNIQKIKNWYSSHFHIISPLVIFLGVAFIINYVPYLNLMADTLATIIISVSFLLIWKLTANNTPTFLGILVFILVCAILLDIIGSRYFAETFGNVFVLLALTLIVIQLWQNDSSIS